MTETNINQTEQEGRNINPVLCAGLFVRKDINGADCRVGDRVRITRPAMSFEHNDEIIHCEEQTWEGQVRLLLSKGILIWVGKEYIKAPLTDKSLAKWIWERL